MNLREYLAAIEQTPYAFFKKHGLPRDPVYRHLRGAGVDYETAVAISEATGELVTIKEIMGQKKKQK